MSENLGWSFTRDEENAIIWFAVTANSKAKEYLEQGWNERTAHRDAMRDLLEETFGFKMKEDWEK